MEEWAIDIPIHKPKTVHRFRDYPFDAVITLCDDAARTRPPWVGGDNVAYTALPDPAHAGGGWEHQLGILHQVRDAIRDKVLP